MKTDSPGSRADLSSADSREFDLKDTEELYRALVDQAPDAIFVSDDKFRFIEVNARGCEMSGYSREEVLHRSVFDFMVPEDVVANPLRLDELKQGKTVVNERRLKRKDGTVIPVEVTSMLFRDGRLQGIVRDLTSKKVAEALRKESDAARRRTEQRFRALIEHSHDAIALFDADGTILYASPSTTRLLGYQPEELLQRNMLEFIRPDWQDKVLETFAEVLRRPGVGIPSQADVQNKDGEYRFVEGTFTNLLDEPSVRAIVNNYRDITERKRADEQLRESEEKYRTILERMEEGYAEVDLRGTYVFVNDSFCRITGHSRSELVGASYKEFFDREQCQLLYDIYHQVYLTGEPVNEFEYVVTRKDGTKRLVEESVNLKVDAQGRPIGFSGIRRDVTERKQAEAARRESEEKLTLAMRAANMGSWGLNIDTLQFEADAVAKRMHGFPADEPIAEIYQSLKHMHPEDIPETKRRFKQAFQTRGPFESEYRVVLPDGSTRWISSLGRVHENSRYLIGMVQDITERKRSEAALREREDQYRDLVDNMRDLVCTHDLQGRALFVNRASAELLGYERDELLGTNLREILDDGTRHLFDDYLKTIQTEGEARGLVLVRSRAGESRVWEYHNTLRRDGTSALTVRGLARDITERKQAEDALRASRDQLRALSARVQTAREEEGTRIAREIHDELGGVLTSLKWDLEDCERLLSASTNGEPNASIRKKIPVMADLLDTTIDTVRRISSELRPGVLDDLGLVAAIEWQARQFRQRTGIECICDTGFEEVELSREQATAIFRVFQEILTNVIRHAQATRVDVRMSAAHGAFVLEVKDNGRGITKAEQTNTRSLGLLGMHERVQLIGGTIEISGAKGKGTRVFVKVPLA